MQGDVTLISFSLDQVLYAIDVDKVQEVVLLPELTPLADASALVSGLFNLRGHMVAAVDLRRRLGLKQRELDVKNAVLIVPSGENLYGLIVDEARSLITLSSQDIVPAPNLSEPTGNVKDRFVPAVGRLNERLIPILNLNVVLMEAESQKFGKSQATEHND